METFLGVSEAAELLGLTRQGLHKRRLHPDFPKADAVIAGRPAWARSTLVEYARVRSERFEERETIEELAREDEEWIPLARAAATIGVPERVLRDYLTVTPGARRWRPRTGEIWVRYSALGSIAAELGRDVVEERFLVVGVGQ